MGVQMQIEILTQQPMAAQKSDHSESEYGPIHPRTERMKRVHAALFTGAYLTGAATFVAGVCFLALALNAHHFTKLYPSHPGLPELRNLTASSAMGSFIVSCMTGAMAAGLVIDYIKIRREAPKGPHTQEEFKKLDLDAAWKNHKLKIGEETYPATASQGEIHQRENSYYGAWVRSKALTTEQAKGLIGIIKDYGPVANAESELEAARLAVRRCEDNVERAKDIKFRFESLKNGIDTKPAGEE